MREETCGVAQATGGGLPKLHEDSSRSSELLRIDIGALRAHQHCSVSAVPRLALRIAPESLRAMAIVSGFRRRARACGCGEYLLRETAFFMLRLVCLLNIEYLDRHLPRPTDPLKRCCVCCINIKRMDIGKLRRSVPGHNLPMLRKLRCVLAQAAGPLTPERLTDM